MKTIWKFDLLVQDQAEILMPSGAEVLSIQATVTPAFLRLWAIVDPEAPKEPRRFEVRGTGHSLGNVGNHLATVQADPLVWHVFEAVGPEATDPPEGYRYVQKASDKEPRLVKVGER